jgi:lipid-A-disaccharide synthase
MRFLISAGEASGERYGAQLMAALRQGAPSAIGPPEFFGVGGKAMRAKGCDIVVDASQVAVLGLWEVLGHLKRIYTEFRRLLREADHRRPDAAILIDFPDFNFRLARQLHRRGIPVFYYISPQLWAWRSGRIELVRRYVRKMLVIFPFEEQWYRERGVDAVFVGHPLADEAPPAVTKLEFAQRHGADLQRPWIALLPGSRRQEVRMNLPAMLAAGKLLGEKYQFLLPVASTLDSSWMRELTASSGLPLLLTDDARTTLLHAEAAVVASGTATVDAALAGTPFVMVYRISPLTWAVGRWLVRVQFFGMVNLIAGRKIVPELIQGEFTAERVAGEIRAIVADGPARRQMRLELDEVRRSLAAGRQDRSAAARAAEAIWGALAPAFLVTAPGPQN